jgi:hypothetical protein
MNTKIEMLVRAALGSHGKMISYSKSKYREDNPENLAIFNANLVLLDDKQTYHKVWHGDIDITKQKESLKELASKSNCTVIILREMDGRFEHEGNPLVEKFVYKVTPDGVEETKN